MARITNTSGNPLSLPSGEVLLPNQSTEVKAWDADKENPVVKAWLESGQIKEGSGSASPQKVAEDEDEDEDDAEVEDEDDEEEEDNA